MTSKAARAPDEFQSAVRASWNDLNGLELLRAVAAGRIPHPGRYGYLGLRLREARAGEVELDWTPPPALCNFAGGVDGGYIAMVFDQVCCNAAVSRCDRGYPMLTLNLTVDYFRPVVAGHSYRARAELVHFGRKRLVARASLLDSADSLLAQASATVLPNLLSASKQTEEK
ncbi:PaaI family thioesterase [Amycolatopsis anabasis]|uniref:PaaI family thioesterase n=1 Tax=Amycolatopsis anabasis TaxID=1840409 RepID=UPI00131CF582|nr:PaaI family thioesterase [Amycolatopsis anabasis]